MRHAAAGLLTPGGSEDVRIQLEVAAKVARASGGGSSGGGGKDGARGLRLQRTTTWTPAAAPVTDAKAP